MRKICCQDFTFWCNGALEQQPDYIDDLSLQMYNKLIQASNQWGSMRFMEAQEYKFELKNEISELKVLNQHLTKWAKNTNLTANSVLRINICLDELFTNIVSYGFEDDLEHKIKFTLIAENDLLTINIEDDGIPFNPLEKIDPEFPDNLDSAKIGGLGIHIIKKLMDNVHYERRQGNKLTMKKKIRDKCGR